MYELNLEGGYFYRFYPKVASLRDKKNEAPTLDLFNPIPSYSGTIVDTVYGKFVRKDTEKGRKFVELHVAATFFIQDNYIGTTEKRELQSFIHLVVNDELYIYPYEVGKIYTISTTEVKQIRL